MSSPTREALDRAQARVRAVTLDVGGTMIACHPSVGEIYAEVAAQNGVGGLDPAELNRRFAAAFKAHPQFTHTRELWAALVDATFEGLVPEPPSRTFFPQLYEKFAEPGAWRVFPDVLPAIRDLRARGLKLGIISNWDERLRPLLGRLGLAGHFDAILISQEEGCGKPDRRIFERAAARLEIPIAEMLHVGDSPAHDAAGARAAGAAARLLDRAGTQPGPETIRSLSELRALAG